MLITLGIEIAKSKGYLESVRDHNRTALIIIDNDLEAKLQSKSAALRKQPSHDNTLFVESKPDPKRLSEIGQSQHVV